MANLKKGISLDEVRFVEPLEERQRRVENAFLAECFYDNADDEVAARYYDMLSDLWTMNYSPVEVLQYRDSSSATDVIGLGDFYDHMAIAYEHLGRLELARRAIRIAKAENDFDAIPKKQIAADYRRMDSARIGSLGFRTDPLLSEVKQNIYDRLRAYALAYPAGSDKHDIAERYGPAWLGQFSGDVAVWG